MTNPEQSRPSRRNGPTLPVQSGADPAEQPHPPGPRTLYLAALQRGSGNRVPAFNLSVYDLRAYHTLEAAQSDTGLSARDGSLFDTAARRRELARERLATLAPDAEPGTAASPRGRTAARVRAGLRREWDDPVWYRAVYQLAAEDIYDSSGRAAAADDALARARHLVRAIESVLLAHRWTSWISSSRRKAWRGLRSFAADIEDTALFLLCGAELAAHHEAAAKQIQAVAARRPHVPRTRHARRSVLQATGESRPSAGKVLEFALAGDVGSRRLSYRARYNLACLYAQTAEHLKEDKALDAEARNQLQTAIDTGPSSIEQWALVDPSLRWLLSRTPDDRWRRGPQQGAKRSWRTESPHSTSRLPQRPLRSLRAFLDVWARLRSRPPPS